MPGTPRSQNRRTSSASGTFVSPTTPGSGGIVAGIGSIGLGGIHGNSPGQSSSTAGTFGPPLQQQPPASQRYSFLVSGQLASGHQTLYVDPSVIQKVNAQITRWEGKKSHVNWAGFSSVSHKRCSETRVQQFRKTKNPPASENPNEACANCVANKMICVLVGGNGPVVVPLPVSERSPGATPTSGDYYVKS